MLARLRRRLLSTMATALLIGIAQALPAEDATVEYFRVLMPSPAMLASKTFVNGHPDLRWRSAGMQAMGRGDFGDAHRYLRRAAEHADKPSQAMIAEMLWAGQGGGKSPALAYAWMDLAAERGYRRYLVRREYFWQELSEAEQQQAIAVGQEIYDQYGDDVAKKRQAAAMRRARAAITGSRVGHVGYVQISDDFNEDTAWYDGFFPNMVAGEILLDRRFWEPEKYWQWHDAVMDRLPTGTIEVLPIQASSAEETE